MTNLSVRRHRTFYLAIAAGAIAGLGSLPLARDLALSLGVNAFFAVYLGLTSLAVPKLTAAFLRQHSAQEDEPAPFILFVMLAAVAVSAVSLFLVLIEGPGRVPLQFGLGIASVLLGWFAVHTMWAMHYAFEYYQDAGKSGGKKRDTNVVGGLEFPGGDDPDGTAFVYFAYVIGMTAQTADTNITSNAMRRLVTVHSVFSFFFNTIIVAAAVNIAVGLAK